MGFPNIQTDGNEAVVTKKVYYTGADTLIPGQLLCFDWDNASASSSLTTAAQLTENLRRRAVYVEKPKLDNMEFIAGYVQGGQSNLTGPCWVNVVAPETMNREADVYTNLSITAGDLLGIAPGSYFVSKWTVGPVLGVALQTIDRSATSGLVRCYWGTPITSHLTDDYKASKRFGFFDDFAGPNQSSSAANGALAGFNTYIATGISSTQPIGVGATDGPGGKLKLTTDSTGSRPSSIQQNGEPYILAANKPCFFRARVTKDSIAATSQGFCGLSITDTSLNASDPTDYIAFKAATAILTLETRKASGTKATLATGNAWVAGTFKDLAFYWDGNASIYAWEDGVAMAVTQAAAAISALPLTLSAEVYDTAAAPNIMTLDRWGAANAR